MANLDPVSLGIVPCVCGRLSNKRHCPHCGCYTIYGLAKKVNLIDPDTGEFKEWDTFRCRGCGKYFNETEWLFDNCHAPQYRLKRTDKLMTGTKTSTEQLPTLINKGKPLDSEQMNMLIERAKKKYGNTNSE